MQAASKQRGKQKSKSGKVMITSAENIAGFVGDKPIDELLQFIDGHKSKGKSGKKETRRIMQIDKSVNESHIAGEIMFAYFIFVVNNI